ncbi:MAG: cyclic pyranopterin monophosphate synthase MoaC [Aigarchaeota archaeon]|nr:cyclic pyranopterin monophosphate synthase MoaC [Aigarchaeota archaeon]MCX8192925.1 cyclic pyranopterin monophosphate synthase MoaC [Nitrososphaeria archaeon]MDW7986430.1 cyclic pyranopterin monophosphate synthase MoaC [Nitrososphaerota archaeon]
MPLEIRQVNVSSKTMVKRVAIARGFIKLQRHTIEKIKAGEIEKGDPLQVARLAGINSAKLTHLLLPLCHPIRVEYVEVNPKIREDGIEVEVLVEAVEKTGVEMEALTAVSIALLNIWDVVKMYEKDSAGQYPETKITDIRVIEKVKGDFDG